MHACYYTITSIYALAMPYKCYPGTQVMRPESDFPCLTLNYSNRVNGAFDALLSRYASSFSCALGALLRYMPEE